MKTSALFESENESGCWRHEIKFPVNEARAIEISSALAPLLRADANAAASGEYLVKSLYFDTPRFCDYADKELGSPLRQKVRLRGYGSGASYRLEIKIKLDELNLKRSCGMDEKAARALARGELSALESSAAGDAGYIRAYMMSRCYRPAAVIKYTRRALLSPDGGFRLTVDTKIRSCRDPESLFNAVFARDVPVPGAVIEIKYGDFLPSWAARELARCGVSGSDFSKYSLGCAPALEYIL